jgi:hypothetical protein
MLLICKNRRENARKGNVSMTSGMSDFIEPQYLCLKLTVTSASLMFAVVLYIVFLQSDVAGKNQLCWVGLPSIRIKIPYFSALQSVT